MSPVCRDTGRSALPRDGAPITKMRNTAAMAQSVIAKSGTGRVLVQTLPGMGPRDSRRNA
jgi:hypothetical protein